MMEHHFIAVTLDRLGHTPFVIRGEINNADDFANNVEIENKIDFAEFQTEYDITVANSRLEDLRTERNRRLAECDWSQQLDIPEETRLAWQPYRQALRDITNTYNSLEDVIWPTPPV
ncbi:MAG: tail fiber assembly protein [Candidatus Poseidoniales archaeon]